jgi:hypothetical protein
MEETTSALPLTIIVVSGMNIILALEGSLKASKLNPLWFICVTLGFRDLVNHT